jgi:hypothetical protein
MYLGHSTLVVFSLGGQVGQADISTSAAAVFHGRAAAKLDFLATRKKCSNFFTQIELVLPDETKGVNNLWRSYGSCKFVEETCIRLFVEDIWFLMKLTYLNYF